MPELITAGLMLDELKRLYVAFPTHQGMKNNPSGTAELYRETLQELSGEALRAAVKIVIQEDTYFPKVSRLLQVAWEWTRRNRAVIEPELKNPLWCPRCSTECVWQYRWRPKVDGQGFVIVQADADHVLYVELETTQRLLCECASRSLYAPEPDIAGHWMRADKIKWLCGRPRWTAKERAPRWIPPREPGMTPIGALVATTEPVEHAADD